MNVLILTHHFPPEVGATSVLMHELAEDLASYGHRVTVVTGFPNYPTGVIPPSYRGNILRRERLGEIEVIRTFVYASPKRIFWRRVLNFASFAASSVFGGLSSSDQDVLLCPLPLPLGVSAYVVSRLKGIPLVLRVEDIHPDQAVAVGLIRNKHLIALLSWLERFLYAKSHKIVVISQAFKDNLLRKGVPSDKIAVIPDWIDGEFIVPLDKHNDFRRRHGLDDKFVVLYAGTMGTTAQMDVILECAKLLICEDSIRFVLVGEGVKKPALQRKADSLALRNILFLSFQPRELLPQVLASADVSLVTLNRESSENFPSKTFGIMASGRPILAATELHTELAQILRAARCGVCVEPDDAAGLAAALQVMRRDSARLSAYGDNGRQYFVQHFSRKYATAEHERLLLHMTASASTATATRRSA